MDLRMIKTRRDIRNALLDLLDDNRSFESITVSQIARRANISRSTFYDHYSDKYALLNALFDYYVEHPGEVPQEYHAISGGDPLRAVTDYVAGMTDRFAKARFRALFEPNTLSF